MANTTEAEKIRALLASTDHYNSEDSGIGAYGWTSEFTLSKPDGTRLNVTVRDIT